MKYIAIAIAAISFCHAGFSQQPSPAWSSADVSEMTLRECLNAGLESNYGLRIARSRQDVSDNNATPGNAGFFPSADLSGGGNGTLNDIRQQPGDGGDAITSNGVNNNSVNAGVNLSWTIFNGFSVQTTYKKLRELQNEGELNTRMAVENYVVDVAAAYYDFIRQIIRLENMKKSIELSQERVRIAELSYSLGVFSRQEYQQAQLDLNSDRSSLIKQYETLHVLRTRLNELMSSSDLDRKVVPADSLIDYVSVIDRQAVESRMLEDNVYLLAAGSQSEISGLDLKLAKSRSYPYLRANTGYGYTQNWYGSGSNSQQRTMGLNYGLSLGVTLFDGLNRRREIKNAEINRDITLLSYDQTEQGLRKDLSDSWMAYTNNMSLASLEESNVELAQDNYRISMANYKEGLLSGYQLRAAQLSLLNAEERLVSAQYDAKLSEIALNQIAGSVLSYLD